MFRKENGIEVPKNIPVYKCNPQKTLCSSFICVCFRLDAHPVFGMLVGEIVNGAGAGFPLSWGARCARPPASDTGDLQALLSPLSSRFPFRCISWAASTFCRHRSERKRNPGSSEQRKSIGCSSQCRTADALNNSEIKMPLTAFAVRSAYACAD